jgi:ubiquinone/menaquinone biosynthesis C-methylase UbiE
MERSSTAWSQTAQLYVSSLAAVPTSISIVAVELLHLDESVHGQNINFVDVAAGPGILSVEVLARMTAHKLGGHLLITDFATGMVEAAQKRMTEISIPSDISIDYQVMDGQALTIADASITHAGCMFGIMFYPDYRQGLRELHRILVPQGRCVIGTWYDAGFAHVTNDFAAFLGLPSDIQPNEAVANLNKMLEIGKDPDALRTDLLDAGFSSVEVYSVPTTYKSADWSPFLMMLRNNPAASQFFVHAPENTEWDMQWKSFLTTSSYANKYVPNGSELEVRWMANVAVATA